MNNVVEGNGRSTDNDLSANTLNLMICSAHSYGKAFEEFFVLIL